MRAVEVPTKVVKEFYGFGFLPLFRWDVCITAHLVAPVYLNFYHILSVKCLKSIECDTYAQCNYTSYGSTVDMVELIPHWFHSE